ncbi:MAG: iron chelate uptake ABC transporter family permease subunit [Phycisphaerales bacterium]|nr:iron chelate uptake ABC transporter family permease subunit [Phycisphaerales bacterium]
MKSGHSIADSGFTLPSMEHVVRVLLLEEFNTRVVVLGIMALGVAAGLVGTFLLLRKRALTADALSHATLPGIAIAFMVMVGLGGSGKVIGGLLIGAFVLGCVGVLLILAIRRTTHLKDDAAIGIVLSVMFGLGICLLRLAQELPSGSAAGLGGFVFGKAASMVPSDAWGMLVMALMAGIAAALLRKELTLLCFDESFASSQGWSTLWLDVLLMALVAAVTVVALQSVGLVLAVAMLIIPAAAARYWTQRVSSMLIAAAIIGCLGGWLGGVVSAIVPRMPTGPVIVLVFGFWFVISFVAGSNDGLVLRAIRRISLARRVSMQNLLRAFWECSDSSSDTTVAVDDIVGRRSWSNRRVRGLLSRGRRRGLVGKAARGKWSLTDKGSAHAQRVVRNHRLWEAYLVHFADIAANHVDRDADQVEHILGRTMVERLEATLGMETDALPVSPHDLEGGSS